MIIYVLDNNFSRVGILDSVTSAIFTKRYYDTGDFEIYTAADSETVKLLTGYNYIVKSGDDTVYEISNINITTDTEQGNYITVSGYNIEKILDRRIIWKQTNFSGTVSAVIRKFINENAISPEDEKRIIPRLRLGSGTGSDEITIQKTGQNLLEVVIELCKSYGYGFRMNLDFETRMLTFNLYQGQKRNVQFSAEYDNLLSTNYNYQSSEFKNTVLVAGEGEGTARVRESINTSASGMNRYELYVDARDLSSNGGEISESEYRTMLKTRGREKLAEHGVKEEYEGEVIVDSTFIYGEDYDLGDIVIVKNEYGLTAQARIIEVIECEDETGHTFIPTFDKWEVQ